MSSKIRRITSFAGMLVGGNVLLPLSADLSLPEVFVKISTNCQGSDC